MKTQWQVVDCQRNIVIKTFDTEEEANAMVEAGPSAGVLGTVIWTVRKVWTNKR